MAENPKTKDATMDKYPRSLEEIVAVLQQPTPPENISFVYRRGSLIANPQDKKIGTAVALPHIDARFTQSRLDEACGPFGWQSRSREVAGVMMVGIGIKNPETNEWIWKWDTGQETPERDGDSIGGKKGLVSNGLKRAGYQWGIGRDAYDYPVRRLQCRLNAKGNFAGWVQNPKIVKEGDFETEEETTQEGHSEEEPEEAAVQITPAVARRKVFDYAVGIVGMINKEANAWIVERERECGERTVECYRTMYAELVELNKANKPTSENESGA